MHSPGESAVGIWRVQVDSGSDCPKTEEAVLSPEELDRARRLRQVRDYRRFVFAHAALRHILSQYIGTRPADLRFTVGPHGKPYLAASGSPAFSMSYSADMTLIAVSRQGRVGVDVERVRNLAWGKLAHRHFTPQEVSALWAMEKPERRRGFFRLWTCKEAFLKALGVGLTVPLNGFEVELRPGQPAGLRGEAGEAWALAELDVPAEYAAAVVTAR